MADEYQDKTMPVDETHDIAEITEELYSILGIPVVKSGEKAIKDPCSGEYFPIHSEYDLDIKSRIHFL